MAFKNRGNTMNAMFTTNQYKVLEVMYENTLSIADKEYCPLGQGEIADELGLSRAVVNKIFTELKEAGYISMVTSVRMTTNLLSARTMSKKLSKIL